MQTHSDPVNNAIRKYESHSRVTKIRQTVTIASTFYFSGADKTEVLSVSENTIGILNSSKVETLNKNPTKCLKVASDICSQFLEVIWNDKLILNKNVPEMLNFADVTLFLFSVVARLVWVIEKWKHQLGKNGFAGVVLFELSNS